MSGEQNKLKEIYQGWKNLVWKDPEIEKIAKERALICARCPFNVDNKCNKCGCYLPAKTRSINSKCPDGKW